MCGIFGGISEDHVGTDKIITLAKHARRRGTDSSGITWHEKSGYRIIRSDSDVRSLYSTLGSLHSPVIFGHSRLATHGSDDNQPIERFGVMVIHNGIILNAAKLWEMIGQSPKLEVDSEILAALSEYFFNQGYSEVDVAAKILDLCIGVINCVIFVPKRGTLTILTNNGSLFYGKHERCLYFSSESFALRKLGIDDVKVCEQIMAFQIPLDNAAIRVTDRKGKDRRNLLINLRKPSEEAVLLNYETMPLLRCTRCILPETMPFITFDDQGVCNYCLNYKLRNQPKPQNELVDRLAVYHKPAGDKDCILPFSGGRDSSFGLHLAVEEFGMKPIAYTYDWGMVTDLGRRNISLMCSKLGVENIVVAADIEWKRLNIRKNLIAWLRDPHLGMLSLLTAGDKHFFRHIEAVKRETGIDLNLWSINPLEVTHFKAGFLGIRPNFLGDKVYQSGLGKQLEYQFKRFKMMSRNLKYFNLSLLDTLSGEYFRSRAKDVHYFHLFDYWKWDEREIDDVLDTYGWERAEDTSTTWRIGDGTAAFYNYVYHRVAGFSEHDTFRSNQIREGDLSREDAMKLVENENLPRYENIRWYLDILDLHFVEVIKRVNQIPRMESFR